MNQRNPRNNPARRYELEDLESKAPIIPRTTTDIARVTVRQLGDEGCRIWIASDKGSITLDFSKEEFAHRFFKKVTKDIERLYE